MTACEKRPPQSSAEGQESRPAVVAKQRAAHGGLPDPVHACQMEHRVRLCVCARPTESNCMCWVVVVVVGSHAASCALQLPSLPQQWLRRQTERLFLSGFPQHREAMWAPSLVRRRQAKPHLTLFFFVDRWAKSRPLYLLESQARDGVCCCTVHF